MSISTFQLFLETDLDNKVDVLDNVNRYFRNHNIKNSRSPERILRLDLRDISHAVDGVFIISDFSVNENEGLYKIPEYMKHLVLMDGLDKKELLKYHIENVSFEKIND